MSLTRSQVAPTVKKLRVATSSTTPLSSTSSIRGHAFQLDQPVPAGGADTAPSPMEALLGSVLGCTQVIVTRTAAELGLDIGEQHAYALAEQDSRGQAGIPGVQTYFDRAALQIAVSIENHARTEAELRAFAHEVHRRCPGLNLLQDANVALDVVWDFATKADPTITDYRLHERLGVEARVQPPASAQLPHTSFAFSTAEVTA